MWRGRSPPSGERWLRECGGSGEEDLHRLASGGYGRRVDVARKISTVWRTVATGERWLREGGGYGSAVATGSALLSHESDGFGNGKTFTILPFDPSVPGLRMLADKTPRFRG